MINFETNVLYVVQNVGHFPFHYITYINLTDIVSVWGSVFIFLTEALLPKQCEGHLPEQNVKKSSIFFMLL